MLHYVISTVLVTVAASSFAIGVLIGHSFHMKAMKDAMKKEYRNASIQS